MFIWLNISGNIETEHVFQSKAFFHLSSNLHTSCFSAFNRETKLQYFNNLETSKNLKPFWDKCRPYFSNRHAHGDSKTILIEKEKITTNTNVIVEKETLLVNNDEIAMTFNKNFAETVEKLNTFEWPSNNEDLT